RDNESGQAQAAALINAAQTPRFNKTPRQSRFYTRLTSLVKHGEFVSDLCYHQATSQEKFHTGNHMRKGLFRQRATFSSDFLAKLQFFLGTFGGIESIARLQTFFITGRRLFRSMV
ncbi:hypothetical protein, partial [uncultured Senegalimassilia sp.]|uniref:hypothetical protein n=1 Tax=uncultured Senegalimassilia sp. TaxID=1714350 RepID=UPI00262F0650